MRRVKRRPVHSQWRAVTAVETPIDTRLREAETALKAATEWAQVTLNSIGDAVITTDLASQVTYLNRVAEALTGWSSHEALGKPLEQVLALIDGHTLEPAANPARRAMDENRTVGLAVNCVLVRKDGSQLLIEDSAAPIHDHAGFLQGAVIVFHDACHSTEHSSKLAYQAQHDALTELPNRALFSERLMRAIGLAKRHHHQAALLYMDLDAFKAINDSLGHAIGDCLLQSVAGRLTHCVRSTDTICRQGGDEFVVLLSEIDKPQDAVRIAEKILATLAEAHSISQHELHVTASVGISIYPDHGSDEPTLLNNADTAMYHAKKSGRNKYQLFSAEMNAQKTQNNRLESQLNLALNADALFLDFQPRIDLATGHMVSAEALVRWHNPTQGLMQPSAFLPIAEARGLIVPIGYWVLGETCRRLQAWRREGGHIVPIAVNMSAMQLRDSLLPARVADILAKTGLEARFLEIEVAEGSLTHLHTDASISTLVELSRMGIRITIDDFGDGRASLKQLQCFPINTINLAPCFSNCILDHQKSDAFTKALINFLKGLSFRVNAKGVETLAQLKYLEMQGCDGAQGFWLSKPLSATHFGVLLCPDRPKPQLRQLVLRHH
ncbi:EAL domain-containing protein [Halomonas sp. CUBES01]|uniref:putative bifunctional diguanylate cyclase/phosphodiesterase n=1 Tax=Halomonas sp. CUBES01 TaxID=2897340 RepID=UPI001E2BFFAA|nr:EAL domain-containing protein [Halomonas sp. CUBES01]MEC4768196.1 EAL domain-containing protein [Halomonas sp. CUBES01]